MKGRWPIKATKNHLGFSKPDASVLLPFPFLSVFASLLLVPYLLSFPCFPFSLTSLNFCSWTLCFCPFPLLLPLALFFSPGAVRGPAADAAAVIILITHTHICSRGNEGAGCVANRNYLKGSKRLRAAMGRTIASDCLCTHLGQSCCTAVE